MVSQLLLGVLNFLPGLLLLYIVLGGYEAHFDDRAMFFAIMGGLILGILLWIAEGFIITDAGILFIVPALTLVETMGKTMFAGLPRFRGERQTVLLTGAMAIVLAPMLLMFYSRFIQSAPVDTSLIIRILSVAVGYTLAHFVTGMIVGQGPARGNLLKGFLPGALWLLPVHVLLGLLAVVEGGPPVAWMQGDLVWAVLIAVYGISLFLWKGPRLLVEGLDRRERKAWYRQQREQA